MAQRTGSADLPLHTGRVPPWLGQRMARLGAVISEAIVHHYGRDELLRRLAHPFWFQSFGAVMGMDWHSSGITTSVIGALKRGLAPLARRARAPRLRRPRQAFAEDAARAGRDRRARRPRRRGAGAGQPAGRQGRQRRGAGRLRPLSARLHRRRRRQLGGGAAGHERRAPAGAPLSLAVGRADELRRRAARRDRGPGQGEIVNLTDRRAEASRARPARAAARRSGPTGSRARSRASTARQARAAEPRRSRCCRIWSCRRITTCAPSDVIAAPPARRRSPPRPSAGPTDFAELLLVPGVGARTVRVAGDGGRGDARRAVPLRRSGALLARARRQGRPSIPGAAERLRRDDRRAEVGGAEGASSAATRSSARIRRLDEQARALERRPRGPSCRGVHRRGAAALARSMAAAACSARSSRCPSNKWSSCRTAGLQARSCSRL